MLLDNDKTWAHYDADVAECKRMIAENRNHSSDWWRARLSGLEHARELFATASE